MSGAPLRDSANRVQEALAALGFPFEVVEFPESTRTSAEAAAVAGCELAQIAKSLVFRAKTSDRPVLVITSGVNRVDEKKVAALIGEKVGRADADFVREKTGFAIGGVPPVGHRVAPVTLIDQDLMGHSEVWSAAGTPHAIFPLSPNDLARMTEAQVADVRKD